MNAAQHDIGGALMLFDHARRTVESNYAKNPYDADNLTKWGEALVELSQPGDIRYSEKMAKDAISQLEEALGINATTHETLWYIGNVHTSHAFLTPDHDEAQSYFESASQFFREEINKSSMQKKDNTDLKYDIVGWIILAVGIVAWVGMTKFQVPPPLPR